MEIPFNKLIKNEEYCALCSHTQHSGSIALVMLSRSVGAMKATQKFYRKLKTSNETLKPEKK